MLDGQYTKLSGFLELMFDSQLSRDASGHNIIWTGWVSVSVIQVRAVQIWLGDGQYLR